MSKPKKDPNITELESLGNEIAKMISKYAGVKERIPTIIIFSKGTFPDQEIEYISSLDQAQSKQYLLEVANEL